LRETFNSFITIYVKTSNPELRFARLLERKSPRDPRTREQFIQQEKRERELFDLEEVFGNADFVIENDGTLDELYSGLDKLLLGKVFARLS
jgi:dephospho-CoA kinase